MISHYNYKNTGHVLLMSTCTFFFGPLLLSLGIQGIFLDSTRMLFRLFLFFGSFGTLFWIMYMAASIIYWRRYMKEVAASSRGGGDGNPLEPVNNNNLPPPTYLYSDAENE